MLNLNVSVIWGGFPLLNYLLEWLLGWGRYKLPGGMRAFSMTCLFNINVPNRNFFISTLLPRHLSVVSCKNWDSSYTSLDNSASRQRFVTWRVGSFGLPNKNHTSHLTSTPRTLPRNGGLKTHTNNSFDSTFGPNGPAIWMLGFLMADSWSTLEKQVYVYYLVVSIQLKNI